MYNSTHIISHNICNGANQPELSSASHNYGNTTVVHNIVRKVYYIVNSLHVDKSYPNLITENKLNPNSKRNPTSHNHNSNKKTHQEMR